MRCDRASLGELHAEQAAMRALVEAIGQQLTALSAVGCAGGPADARGTHRVLTGMLGDGAPIGAAGVHVLRERH